ncbi:MAG TPA: EAL domain-containing protein [Jatrophihabitans sp.]|jgi:diguanylate cyclase (GGDEF)-like protein
MNPRQWAFGPRTRADLLTLALTLTLAATAAGVTGLDAHSASTLRPDLPSWAVFVALAAMFGLGERLPMVIEFRRQAHTITLAGPALVLGALLAPVQMVVLARLIGSVVALAHRRQAPAKLAYNVAAFSCEAALATALVHRFVGTTTHLGLAAVLGVIGVMVAVDQLFSGLVLLMIRMHNGPVSPRDAIGVLVPAVVMTTVSAAVASGGVMIIEHGAAGELIVAITTATAVMLYRGYLHTKRRHEALELVHEFVTGGAGTESVAEAAHQLLDRIRTLLRAARVEMAVCETADDGDTLPHSLATFVADDGGFAVHETVAPITDWVLLRALTQHQPMLAARTDRDGAVVDWLAQHGYRDAMLIAFAAGSGIEGTVTVVDRLGDTATFTADDLALLQTLTGHLAVAARSAQMVERLAFDANHDALTGLPNRSQLTRTIAARADDPHGAAVLLLDLDRFKEVNDALGHAAGDRLLCVVAERLRAAVPVGATVARFGGDEFAVHLPGVGDDDAAARAVGDRIATALSRPVSVEGAQVSAEASIGIAFAQPGTVASTDLIRRADTAMYTAKAGERAGEPKVAVYHPEMDRGRVENLAMLAELRTALREHPEQFQLLFQPQVDLTTRQLVSAEALARWHHPTLGVVTPDRFIPLLETSGLIDELMPIVLDSALRECRRWHDRAVPISVSVNLSARNAANLDLPRQVGAALRRAGLPPSSLIIEITESSLVSEQQQKVLIDLAAHGVGISLDDFGTGYSSLSYLQRLAVQEVKIDRSFVFGLTTTPEASRALIEGVASLCSALDLRVVAEGAETMEIVDTLAELGCDVVQGYAIARPMPALEFMDWAAHPPLAPPLQLIKAIPS